MWWSGGIICSHGDPGRVIRNMVSIVRNNMARGVVLCMTYAGPSGRRASYVHGILVQIRSISTLGQSLELGIIFAFLFTRYASLGDPRRLATTGLCQT